MTFALDGPLQKVFEVVLDELEHNILDELVLVGTRIEEVLSKTVHVQGSARRSSSP